MVQDDKMAFFDDLYEDYIKKSFGVLNKTELEILFYHLMRKHHVIDDNVVNIKRILKIPESKIQKLNYDAQLKYGSFIGDDLILNIGEPILNGVEFLVASQGVRKVKFLMEDKYLRENLSSEVKKKHPVEARFGGSTITLSTDAIIDLVIDALPQPKKDGMVNEYNAQYNEHVGFDNLISGFKSKIKEKQGSLSHIKVLLKYYKGEKTERDMANTINTVLS